MATDIKLIKAEICKIIQLAGFLGEALGKLGKESIARPCCSFG